MLSLFVRFIYHLVRQTEGLHWGLLLACFVVLALVFASYHLACWRRPRLACSILGHNMVMLVGAACFLIAVVDVTLGRRVGEVISIAPDLTPFDWLLDPDADLFKQALYALLNVVLFIPLSGFFSALWNSEGSFVRVTPVVGALCVASISIEVAQAALHLGYFQLEDVICNAVGVVLGALLARGVCRTRSEIESGV